MRLNETLIYPERQKRNTNEQGVHVSMYLKQEEYDKLKVIASKNGWSINQAIRILILNINE